MPLPPEVLGPKRDEHRFAEKQLADALGLDREAVSDGWGEGQLVLEIDEPMLEKCRALIDAQPPAVVITILVDLLNTSYHLRPVHDLVVKLTERFYREWLAGSRSQEARDVIRDLAHAFRHGVRNEDFDLLVELCAEESFRYDSEGELDIEDLRGYWMDSLMKVKDDRVGDLFRSIVQDDVDVWEDYRIADAIRGLARFWQPADEKLVARHANDHPDSYVRQVTRRVLKRHSQQP